MNRYDAVEIAELVEARINQEYPSASFACGPRERDKRINQQIDLPGGRVIMLPGSVSPGERLFFDMQEEAGAVLDTWVFECFGFDANPCATYAQHYARAQRLADIVFRAFFPFAARIKFASGQPGGQKQSNVIGALLSVSYVVRRPVQGLLSSGEVPDDGGTGDYDMHLLSDIQTTIEVE